jgi:probable F420-dependent oxidoreductase
LSLGVALPHRALTPLHASAVEQIATRAERLGFDDLWVTENTLDQAYSYDPMVVLSYAAAITSRIRLAVAVIVLPVHAPAHVAHQIASLDSISGGRTIVGVGLGRPAHFADFGLSTERRTRRFIEGIELMRALWTQDVVDFDGEIYHLRGAHMAIKPVQRPHPPLWLGGAHANAIRRAVALGDGWIGSGNQPLADFGVSVRLVREELERSGRDPSTFSISKRVFMSVHDRTELARADVDRWFGGVYRNPAQAQASGVWGTPALVGEQLEELKALGLTHLLLNPVARDVEQLEALADLAGLGSTVR